MKINKVYSYIKMRLGLNFLLDYRYGKTHKFDLGKIGDKNIYFLMTPTYGNMGDQAIEYATRKFISDFFPEYNVISINLEKTLVALNTIEKTIKPNDFIILQGGGNFGDFYPYCEEVRRFVIKKIRNNIIVSMPTTLTYSNEKKELNKSERIINSNKNFINLCREKYSYDFSEYHFPHCKNILCPDIAYYLDDIGSEYTQDRTMLCVCLRNDIEKVQTIDREKIIKKLFDMSESIIISDTQLYRSIPNSIKNEEMKSIINKFRSYQLVVTDRLHGMILSYITRTPCIVFPSVDKKIVGSYEWINNSNYIRFCNQYDEKLLLELCNELIGISAQPNVSLLKTIKAVGAQLKEIIENGKVD